MGVKSQNPCPGGIVLDCEKTLVVSSNQLFPKPSEQNAKQNVL